MSTWWSSLGLEQQVFYGIALFATALMLIQVLLALIGADHPHDLGLDVDADGDHSSGVGLLSIQSIATFFVGFGWVGVIWLHRGHGLFFSILAATIIGVVLTATVVMVLRALTRLQESGTLDYHNAVGATGTVYCPVPPHRANGGQVEVLIQGRTVFADAITDAAEPLKTGAKVHVTSILGQSTLIVEPR